MHLRQPPLAFLAGAPQSCTVWIASRRRRHVTAGVRVARESSDVPFRTHLVCGLKGHNKSAQGIALGFQGIALGFRGIALGFRGIALGFRGIALGFRGIALGFRGIALGFRGIALGFRGIALGFRGIALGFRGIALGFRGIALGFRGIALGVLCVLFCGFAPWPERSQFLDPNVA